MLKPDRIKRVLKRCYHKGISGVRHRRGHGVHSPFVFNFIIRVIEEKAHYYAYATIKQHCRWVKSQVPNNLKRDIISLKKAKLIFRVSNRFMPSSILVCGTSCGVLPQVLKLACKDADITSIEQDCNLAKWSENAICETYAEALPKYFKCNTPAMVYIDAKTPCELNTILTAVEQNITPVKVIMINEIHKNKDIYNIFKEFNQNRTVKVTIDLFDMAILVISPKLNKQKFKLSF